MKKKNLYLLLPACALGLVAFSTKNTAAEDALQPTGLAACCSGGMAGCSGMTTPMADTNTNGVPDLLKTCPVSGEKLGGDMGAPFVFSYKDQQVKLCCKSCKKDFDKDPAKYMKL